MLTPFAESNALLAQVRDDLEERDAVFETMTAHELRQLAKACDRLSDAAEAAAHYQEIGGYHA